MSISSGVAPAISIAATVATAVCETVTTVQPGPTPSARNASASAEPGREFRLEGATFGAEDVPTGAEGARHRRIDLGLQRAIAGAGIGLRHGDGGRVHVGTSEIRSQPRAIPVERTPDAVLQRHHRCP